MQSVDCDEMKKIDSPLVFNEAELLVLFNAISAVLQNKEEFNKASNNALCSDCWKRAEQLFHRLDKELDEADHLSKN